MAFTTLDLLAAVVAALFSANAGALYRLTFDNACAGLRITPEAYPQALSDGRVELLPGAVCAPLPKVVIDGLITNDKFCFTRRSRLKLRPKRRGYPPLKDVRRGGIDETELDRSTHDGRPRQRHPSLGSGLPAPPPMGGLEGNPEGGGD
jgi:hypothetical protein